MLQRITGDDFGWHGIVKLNQKFIAVQFLKAFQSAFPEGLHVLILQISYCIVQMSPGHSGALFMHKPAFQFLVVDLLNDFNTRAMHIDRIVHQTTKFTVRNGYFPCTIRNVESIIMTTEITVFSSIWHKFYVLIIKIP